MKKRWIAITLLALLLLLVGCTQENENTDAAITQGSGSRNGEQVQDESVEETVELRLAWWGGEDRHSATIDAVNKYMEMHPNVKVVYENQGWEGYKEKIYTQLASGNAPHLFQNHYTWLPEQAVKGDLIKDLSGYMEQLNEDIFPEGFLDTNVNFDGKTLAIPVSLNTTAIVANKQLLDEAEIDYTKAWSFEDYFEANQKLKALNTEYFVENGMASSDIHKYWFAIYLTQLTGKKYTTDYQLSYDYEDVVSGFSFIKRMFDEGAVEPLGTLELYSGKYDQNPKWINGESALSYGMLSTIDATANVDYETVVIQPPILAGALDSYYKIICGHVFSIPESASDKETEEAVKLLEWLMNSEEAAKELGLSRGIPISSAQKKVLEEENLINPQVTQAEQYIRDLGDGIGEDTLIRNKEIEAIGAEIISKVAFDMLTPEEAASEYIELINVKLSELKPE